MTSLFVTIVAIVLFGIISMLAVTYIDTDNAKAATQAPVVATAMGNMIEAAAMYRSANDAAPADETALNTVITTPAVPNIEGAEWVIDTGSACLVLPTNSGNTDLLNAAAIRVSTSQGSATVSTTCGSLALTGKTAIVVPI